MKAYRVALSTTLLSLALVVLLFSASEFLTAPVWIAFQKVAGLAAGQTIAHLAAALATACLFVAAAWIAIPAALKPAPWIIKSIQVLPAYLLALTLAAVIANLAGIATLGSLLGAQSTFKLSLAVTWLAVGAGLSTLAVVIASARVDLGDKILRAATIWTVIAVVPSLILCLAMLASIVLVATNQASLFPNGAQGDAGGLADLVTQSEIGGGLMTVFTVIGMVGAVNGVRAWRAPAAVASAPAVPAARLDLRREVQRALVSCAAISVVLFAAMQLVPVSRDNPPVQGVVQWDSPQTKELVSRACMNCHSNETVWPWYSYFAPGSWITVVHVDSARQQFNLSELNKMPASRRRRLLSDMVDQIRNSVMPPIDYQLMHPEARLTSVEKEQLIQGLQKSLQ